MKAYVEHKAMTANEFAEMATFWFRPRKELNEEFDDEELAGYAIKDIHALMHHIGTVADDADAAKTDQQ